MIEMLEKRQMLSVTIVGSVLKVVGTPHSDVILIDQLDAKGSKFSVTINDVEYKVDAATPYGYGDSKPVYKRITRIEVYGDPVDYKPSAGDDYDGYYGGDDFIALSKSVWAKSVLYGGEGDDTMIGGSGEDTFIGGFYADKDDKGFDRVDYSYREEPLRLTLNNVADDGKFGEKDNITTSIEEIIGGQGDDLIVGDKDDNALDGQYGDDVILGLDGDDTIYGSHGDDSLRGGYGDDVLLGHPGYDTVYGDEGNDLVEINDDEYDVGVGGPGWDAVFADTKDQIADFEKIVLVPGDYDHDGQPDDVWM